MTGQDNRLARTGMMILTGSGPLVDWPHFTRKPPNTPRPPSNSFLVAGASTRPAREERRTPHPPSPALLPNDRPGSGFGGPEPGPPRPGRPRSSCPRERRPRGQGIPDQTNP